MQVKVINIEENRVDVQTRQGREHGLDLFRTNHKPSDFQVGQTLEVYQQDNNPFLRLKSCKNSTRSCQV